jgi:inositol phosphorylceramide mannosyltransferase catalytic subunit
MNQPLYPLIPKNLHAIWIGPKERPDRWIDTWRDQHPDWQFRLWGNEEYRTIDWVSRKQMDRFEAEGHWAGIADLMRYEILFRYGGFYVDADMACIRPLDEWLLHNHMVAVRESELHRAQLIANSFIGSVAGHPALYDILQATSRMNSPVRRWSWKHFRKINILPWKSVGPRFFTKMICPYCPELVTVLPSILFLPQHFLDLTERSCDFIYARHFWGSTRGGY